MEAVIICSKSEFLGENAIISCIGKFKVLKRGLDYFLKL